jgi:hypothetical protein
MTAKRYKDRCRSLKRDIKVLERSNTLSQRALKHTEHFVEEVVHVNDKLVQSLATSRKYRRL